VPIGDCHFRGEAIVVHNSAIAGSGPQQVEFDPARNDVPSTYRNSLQTGLTGSKQVVCRTSTTVPRLLGE
jgi:hypothetical protein